MERTGRIQEIISSPARRSRVARLIEQERGYLLNIYGAGTRRNNEIVEHRAAAGLGPWHTLPADRLPKSSFD